MCNHVEGDLFLEHDLHMKENVFKPFRFFGNQFDYRETISQIRILRLTVLMRYITF